MKIVNEIERISDTQGVSINQFALFALTKEIVGMEDHPYYQALLKNKTREDILGRYDHILANKKYSDENVPDWDKV